MTEPTPNEKDIAVELLQRMANGSEKALREFYQLYHGRVYNFAIKRLQNPTDAADVLNEVMLEAWRSAGRFEGRSRASTWLLGIAHHKIIDTLRRNKRQVHEDIDPEWEDETSVAAIDMIAGAQDSQQLRNCIDKLSDSQRLVVHLAFFEDLGYEEISEIAECPLGTVKSRMFHAREALKRCLIALNPGAFSRDIPGEYTDIHE